MKLVYQEVLRKSGCKSTLKYKEQKTETDAEILYGSMYHLVKMSPQT